MKRIRVRSDTVPVQSGDDGLRDWREDIAVYDRGRAAQPVARIRFMEVEAYTSEAAAAITERLREGS